MDKKIEDLKTPEDVLEFISDGSGRPPKIVESTPEEVRDMNINVALFAAARNLARYYDVTVDHVINLMKELDND